MGFCEIFSGKLEFQRMWWKKVCQNFIGRNWTCDGLNYPLKSFQVDFLTAWNSVKIICDWKMSVTIVSNGQCHWHVSAFWGHLWPNFQRTQPFLRQFFGREKSISASWWHSISDGFRWNIVGFNRKFYRNCGKLIFFLNFACALNVAKLK